MESPLHALPSEPSLPSHRSHLSRHPHHPHHSRLPAPRLDVPRNHNSSLRNRTAGLFRSVPLFMREEDPQRLLRHKPPYGYRFGTFRADELRKKRANATLPARRAYGSCAVVGSSGTLLRSRRGAEIDAHDSVIRINAAPLPPKLHAWTGSRTTIRVFASPHAGSNSHFKEEALFPRQQTMLVVCDRPYVYSCQNVLFATRKPNWHGINPIFYAAVRRQTDKRKHAIPLTGVVAVAAATRLCSSVDVYGLSTMEYQSQTKKTCFYYWMCSSTDKWYHSRPGDSQFHDFKGNARALLRWNASGIIRLRS
ncbi:hypothetical protein AB1Y20_022125 [Prymnesium parvum]|uniref:Uncharacterized protein n=1 Tax=Prymnesium parvum TaxID=97485 RepID=A0AB34JG74_PRYPA